MIFGSISCRHEMNYGLIPAIPELYGAPASLIKYGLPNILAGVGTAVHDAAIAQYDGGLVTGLRDLHKDILEVHLQLHEIYLEFYCVTEAHLWGLNQGAAKHQDRCGLRDNQHAVADLFEVELERGQSCSLAGTGSACYANPSDWRFCFLSGLVIDRLLDHGVFNIASFAGNRLLIFVISFYAGSLHPRR